MFSVSVVLSLSGILWNSVTPAHSILLYLVSCIFYALCMSDSFISVLSLSLHLSVRYFFNSTER